MFCSSVLNANDLLVAVASNFRRTFDHLTPLFEQMTGHRVQASFASTGQLAAQIDAGAPFAIFLAADDQYRLHLNPQTQTFDQHFIYALGKLILWRNPPGFPAGADTLEQRLQGVQKIALANPTTAPYGRAAQEVLTHVGVLEKLRSQLVFANNVGQTLSYLTSGNAEAGFVALAQILESDLPGSYWIVPQTLYTPIRQEAILLENKKVTNEKNSAAQAFMTFLQSQEARKIIAQGGYDLP
ncbi:MAG: molybdate ABC transporter substrate-binding protein [Magnetococcus sp. DMHC-6]